MCMNARSSTVGRMSPAKVVGVLAFTFIVLSFAIQPCFAGFAQVNPNCCGAPKSCHHPGPARICVMQATAFSLPEELHFKVMFTATLLPLQNERLRG
jgi:hypothetical protein